MSETFPSDMTPEEWREIFEMAQQQALLGVLFDGIQRMPSPPVMERSLLLKWYALSEQIRARNEQTNHAAVKVTKFFREQGFRSCVLKGQGNTLNYPNPSVRTSGDIDLWVEGGDEKVLAFVRKKSPKATACYHHVDFRAVDGVEVEVHYRPLFMNNLIHNGRLQRWFVEKGDKQFGHEVSLPGDAGNICVPTNAFNRIYQMAHIYKHMMYEGIGLRQIIDYFFLLKQGFTEEEQKEEEQLLRHLGLYKIASAVMYVLKEVLGLEEQYLLVSPHEPLGQFLLDEIMLSGNFGQYDQRVKHDGSQLTHNIQRLKRDLRLMGYFPSECLWEPVFRLYNYFWRLSH